MNAREIRAEPVRDKPIGHGKKLTVFVDYIAPDKRAKPNRTPSCATDSNQTQTVPHFARAAEAGDLDFLINSATFPSSVALEADGALRAGFSAWEGAVPTDTYFDSLVTTPEAPTGPAQDGTNTVGWSRFVNGRTLAAAWVWEEQGRVSQADIFYNAKQPWGAFTTCPGNGAYEIGNVATHEVGHALGLDHLSDPGRQATMYPSAPRGETLKRTLTDGDKAGFQEALSAP